MRSAKTIFLFLIIFISLDLSVPFHSGAIWYSTNWEYRRAVTIDNTGNAAELTNYQVKVFVTYDSDMQSGFDDIRFTDSDGITLLNYWREDYSPVTNATFWVKVPAISASSNHIIYMYYGSPGANSASNGDTTFQFFDDRFLLSDAAPPLLNAPLPLALPEIYRGVSQAVHPSVVYFPDGWNGYKYWMAFTPMPAQYEYPSVLASQDGSNWIEPAGITNPVDEDGMSSNPYNNYLPDVDLVYNEDTNELWMYYLGFNSSNNYLLRKKSSDGITWTSREILLSAPKVFPENSLISPSVVKINSTYHLWYVVQDYVGNTNRIEHRTSADGISWSVAQPVAFPSSYNLWHLDVIYVPGKNEYWMIGPARPSGSIIDYEVLLFAQSTDGINWMVYDNRPAMKKSVSGWDARFVYRASMVYNPDTDMIKVWYSAGTFTDNYNFWIGYTERDFSEFLDVITERWTKYKQGSTNAVITSTNGVLRLSGDSNTVSSANIRSVSTFTNDIVVEVRRRADNEHYRDLSLGAGDIVDSDSGANSNWWHTALKSGYIWKIENSGLASTQRSSSSGQSTIIGTSFAPGSGDTYQVNKFIYDSAGNLKWYIDDVLKDSANDTTFLNDAKRIMISQGKYIDGSGGSQDVDWIFVRKYTGLEPSIFVGPEFSLCTDFDGDGYSLCTGDCNENNASINPAVTEICDGMDNDCNGSIDEGFTDADSDGYAVCAGDCNDNDSSVNRGTTEICDGIDNNCDGNVDEGFDVDSDGFKTCTGDCNDGNSFFNPGTYWFYDSDSDGYGNSSVSLQQCSKPGNYVLDDTDCDDTNPLISPAAYWYPDSDGDGYGNPTISLQQCVQPAGYVLNNTDCDNNDAHIYPGGPPVRIAGLGYFPTLQAAYDAASGDASIQIKAGSFIENLYIDLDKTITIEGGYDCGYSTAEGRSILNGDLIIGNGKITVENLIVQ